MLHLNAVLTIFSGLSFFVYGVLCVGTHYMKSEFRRFGLDQFRVWVGILEILGGTGQLVGLWSLPIHFVSTGGLTLLMFLGVVVRLRLRDGFIQSMQAVVFFILNLYLFVNQL